MAIAIKRYGKEITAGTELVIPAGNIINAGIRCNKDLFIQVNHIEKYWEKTYLNVQILNYKELDKKDFNIKQECSAQSFVVKGWDYPYSSLHLSTLLNTNKITIPVTNIKKQFLSISRKHSEELSTLDAFLL